MNNTEFSYLYENNGSEWRRLYCKHWINDDGFKPPFLHCHTEFEFMLITDGNVRIVNNNIDIHPKTPCILLHRPYTFHVVHAEDDTLYERYHFYFSIESIMKLAALHPPLGRLEGCADLSVYYIKPENLLEWRQLLDSFTKSGSADEGIRLMYTGIAVSRMLELQMLPLPEKSQRRSYIQNVIEYIYDHLSEPLPLEELAERFFVSRSKLIRDFKKYASCSIHEYIIALRLDRACLLLRAGINVTNTAMECGFGHVSSFIRLFHQRFGLSPLQYAGKVMTETLRQAND